MKKIRQLIMLIIFLFFALVFILISYKNATQVEFNYLFGVLDTSLSWLITGAFVLGVAVAFLFFAISNLFWKIRANSLAKQLEDGKLEQQKMAIVEDFNKEKQAYSNH